MSKLKPSKIIQGRVDQNIGLQQAALGMAPPTQARLRMPRKQTQIKLQHCNTCSDICKPHHNSNSRNSRSKQQQQRKFSSSHNNNPNNNDSEDSSSSNNNHNNSTSHHETTRKVHHLSRQLRTYHFWNNPSS